MPELGSLGTVRGALGNERPYREHGELISRDTPENIYTIFIALEGFETALKDFERVSGNE